MVVALKDAVCDGRIRPPRLSQLPALCDMTASSMMNIGLLMTSASVYQMLRGSVIIFTSIASVLFLKRKLRTHHWSERAARVE